MFRCSGGVLLFRCCSVVQQVLCSVCVTDAEPRYFLIAWRCFNVSLFCQCSIVVPRCSALFPLFRGVPLFHWCSVIPLLFCRSAGVPCSGVPVVFPCSVLPQVFRRSGVPGFIVCRIDVSESYTFFN